MKQLQVIFFAVLLAFLFAHMAIAETQSGKIIHDAEFYIIKAQNGDKWAAEDKDLDKRLAKLRKKNGGNPPNIIHFMWDDTSWGDVGIPEINKLRGFSTPNMNRVGKEGIHFTRMYTEPSCTPSRAAQLTGRHAVRTGMYKVGFPVEYAGLPKDEVTIAEVLSQAGYATALYGKLHLGDIEEAWPHNQGFDETLFGVYNQIVSVWNPQAEAMNAVLDLYPEMVTKNPYRLDNRFSPQGGWVMTLEGKKGEPAYEVGGTSNKDFDYLDIESKKRLFAFIEQNAKVKKPFFASWWPMMVNFVPKPEKRSLSRALYTDAIEVLDDYVGELREKLNELGIAENTLIIVMADNGPMSHNPPPGLGMTETIFRGGKGDFLEGGVRVPAFAVWPGVIKEGQLVDDIIHQTDLYTTFSRIGGATEYIPRDRIIDGVDQTALLLNGDTHGRRDYVHIYTGPILAATVKGDYKRHWVSSDPGGASGLAAAFYNVRHDTREKNPMMTTVFHMQEAFSRMRERHMLWKETHPDTPTVHGPAYTGIANVRPETKALQIPNSDLELPFDPSQVLKRDLPWELGLDPRIAD